MTADGLADLRSMMASGKIALLLAAVGLPGREGLGGSPVFKYLLGFFEADDCWIGIWLSMLALADSLETLLKLRIGAL